MWEDLSFKDRSKLIELGASQGILDLSTIKHLYNINADGGYLKWKKEIAKHKGINIDNDKSYNYQAFFEEDPQRAWGMLKKDSKAHFTDKYKTVWHPTFSDESVYSGHKSKYNPQGLVGGHWEGNTFKMSDSLYNSPVSMDDRQQYLIDNEPNGVSLLESNGTLPVYDGIPWGGVLPEVTVTPQYSDGGSIHIAKNKRGTFKAQASRMGMSTQQAASHILANKDDYSPAMVKKAVFAHNFAHADGGDIIHTTGGAGYVPSVSPSFINNTVGGLKEVLNNFTLNPNTQRYRFYKYFDPYAAYDNTSVNRAINLFIGGPNYAKNQYIKDRKKDGISYRNAKKSYREGAASSFDDAVWGTYLGIPKNKRKFKSSLVESKYRPTKGNNDETYYTIPIVNKTKDELVKEAEGLNIGDNKNTNALFGYNMGTSTLGKGYDNRGEYVSYYDKWDINPFHGAFSSYNLKKQHPLLYKILPNDGSDSFKGFTNPVNFYDRIYLDDYYGLKEPSHATYLPEVVVRPNNNALSKLLYADGGSLDSNEDDLLAPIIKYYEDSNPYFSTEDQNTFAKGGQMKKARQAVDYFVNKGLTREQASGLVGNLMRESNMISNATNPNSGAYGLGQWLGSRKTRLFKRYGYHPTFEQQLDYIWDELNTSHRRGLQMLRASKTVNDAARNAFGYYEFSAGPEAAIRAMNNSGKNTKWKNPNGTYALNSGIKNARMILSESPMATDNTDNDATSNTLENIPNIQPIISDDYAPVTLANLKELPTFGLEEDNDSSISSFGPQYLSQNLDKLGMVNPLNPFENGYQLQSPKAIYADMQDLI